MGITPKDALDLEFYANDRDQRMTFRQYFHDLLETLYEEDEGFSGKRPFGNSGWDYSLRLGLVNIGAVVGDYEDGPDDDKEAHRFIFAMIRELCGLSGDADQ